MAATQSDTDSLFKLLEDLGGVGMKHIGHLIAVAPLGQDEEFNFTLPKGQGTNLFMGYPSFLGNKGYEVQKVYETIDVSPVDQGYYNLTQRQKDELEGKIKQGMGSVSQAIADFELLNHDFRKYKEFLKMIKTDDEHSLRAIFIDEVDISTGANSIKQMVVRWPTMISDFIKLGDRDDTKSEVKVDKIRDSLKVSGAEAVVLSTKQRLYLNWKNDLFGAEVEKRCENLQSLINAREKSIDEYRNWLKPTIAKFKLFEDTLSSPGARMSRYSSAFHSMGQAVSSNDTELWSWQGMVGIVGRTGSMEFGKNQDKKRKNTKFSTDPYDDFIKKKLIFDEKDGLKKIHPWIDEAWVQEKVNEICDDGGWLKPDGMYYVLMRTKHNRVVIKLPDGTEMEDVTYSLKMWFYSQNALLVLLLHLKALQKEFEDYVDQILGISSSGGISAKKHIEDLIAKWKEEKKEVEGKKGGMALANISSSLNKKWALIDNLFEFGFALSRVRGNYEHNFADRIATPYLATVGGDFYAVLVGYLVGGAGVGK
jgi:hypothetical protein